MTQFVLDTGMVSLLQHGHRAVAKHLASHRFEEVATTIITVEEQLSAWYTLVRRAKTAKELAPIYHRMTRTIEFLSRLPLLMVEDLGVPDERVIRAFGRNTSEEIQSVKRLIAERGWRRVGLVTSAWEMARAMPLARDAQLELQPLPADFRGTPQT